MPAGAAAYCWTSLHRLKNWSLARTLVHRMHPTPIGSPGFSRWDAGRGRGLLLDKLAPAEELESGTDTGASNAPYTARESRL